MSDTLLTRLAETSDQARNFGDHEMALLLHDARITLLHAGSLINSLRTQLVEAYEEQTKQRTRIASQVEIIRKARAATDPAHHDEVPPAPWH